MEHELTIQTNITLQDENNFYFGVGEVNIIVKHLLEGDTYQSFTILKNQIQFLLALKKWTGTEKRF